jgi:hypothetical protein
MESPDFDDGVTQRHRITPTPGPSLDCSPATVRSQIHRAPASLRTTIGTEEVKR